MDSKQRRRARRAGKKEKDKLQEQLEEPLPSKTPQPKSVVPKVSQPPPSHKVNWWIRLIEIVGLIGFIFCVIAFYFQFWPWINVEPISSTFTDNFQDTKFQVENESPLPIYNLFYATEEWDGDNPSSSTIPATIVMLQPKLSPHVAASIRFSFPRVTNPLTGETVDVSKSLRPMMQISVFYSPFGISLLQTHASRVFWAYKTRNGVYVWCPAGGGEDVRGDHLPKLNPK